MEKFQKRLKQKSDKLGSKFKMLVVGQYQLSIQGSSMHYSTPQVGGPPQIYNEMELAIFTQSGEWIHPKNEFKDFKRLDELLATYESGQKAVGYYVPVDLIQDLINYLKGEDKMEVIGLVELNNSGVDVKDARNPLATSYFDDNGDLPAGNFEVMDNGKVLDISGGWLLISGEVDIKDDELIWAYRSIDDTTLIKVSE